jgi:hypothetical protein
MFKDYSEFIIIRARKAIINLVALNYCTFSPPIGQPGYLQCIIMAQAIS